MTIAIFSIWRWECTGFLAKKSGCLTELYYLSILDFFILLIGSKTRIFVAYGSSIFSSKYSCVNLQTTYGIITESPPKPAIQRFEDIALKL